MEPNAADRRDYTRHPRKLKALLLIDDSWQPAECKDISGSGIRFKTKARPEPETMIEIHVDSLGRFEGQVIRHVTDGFVVQLSSSPVIKEQLDEELGEPQEA
ncbi:PilZ domain-containing protein [Kiloniella laminariae]|uniref:PilZ domain-containing protein n=1 Tax=Kiloniella laminariae TaxID=454162 RepID=UPI00036EF22F|nr:PilZ domain-containing protein [Kiloniella laminariae]